MENNILLHRKAVCDNIRKSFNSDLGVETLDELEKGKWSVGDTKVYQGVTWEVGGFNAKGVPLWRKKKGGAGGGNSSTTSSTSSQNNNQTSSKFKVGESVMTDHSSNVYKVKSVNDRGQYLLDGTSGLWSEHQLKSVSNKSDSSKPTSSAPNKSDDKRGNIPTNVEEALSIVKIDKDRILRSAKKGVNLAYWKEDLERSINDTRWYENGLKNAIEDGDFDKIQRTAKDYGESKLYQEEYIKELNIRKKERKDFLNSTGNDFTKKEVEEYLDKYVTEKGPRAVVNNTWSYKMGSIGSTSATIRIGNGKEKRFDLNDTPSWRPIGLLSYTIRSPYGDSEVSVPIQSWKDIKNNISSTESFYLDLYKHPKQ